MEAENKIFRWRDEREDEVHMREGPETSRWWQEARTGKGGKGTKAKAQERGIKCTGGRRERKTNSWWVKTMDDLRNETRQRAQT